MIRNFIRFTVGMTLSSVALAQTTEQPPHAPKQPLPQIIITTGREDSTQITEEAQKLIDVPGALGDPVAAVFSLPGVVYGDGDGSEPAVRGSSPDDNLFLVDFLPAGYIFHTFTNSVFSENIVQDFQLRPAGFGPQYGNVTGAVFDITLRKPRHQALKTVVDVSMLRSGLFLEGAVTEHSAAYLSVRKSLIHLFVPKDKEQDGVTLKQVPRDADYQFKYAWDVTPEHTLTWAATGASDLAEADFGATSDVAQQNPDFGGDAQMKNHFANQSVIWSYAPDDGPRFKLGAGHMKQNTIMRWGEDYFTDLGLQQWLAKLQYDQPLTDRHTLRLGAQLARNEHSLNYDQILFVCSEFDPTCGSVRHGRITDDERIRETSHEAFMADTWRLTDVVTLDLGAQYQTNTYTAEHFLNPRGALDWELGPRWWLSVKAGRYNRFPDLDTVLPKIGNPELKSPRAQHFTLGFRHELQHGWSWNAEAYYKRLDKLPLSLDPTQPDAARLYSNDVSGRAYGLDLLVNKERTGRWYGWLAMSFAKSERTNQRTDATEDYRLDTPFLLTWVMNYRFTPRFDGGLRLTLRSGQATTPIVGIQPNPAFEGYVQPVYGQPFSERLPMYSRLDLRFKWAIPVGRYDGALILDIINALNIRNVEGRSLDFQRSRNAERVELRDQTGYGILPALTFRVTF